MRQYFKDWYVVNAEAMKERALKWALDNPERKKKRADATYRKENLQKIKEYGAAWRDANPEKKRALARTWSRKNPEKVKASGTRLRKKFPEKHASTQAKRRAWKLRATPSWANDFYVSEAYHLAKLRTEVTGFEWHVDHQVPLKSKFVCGLHVEYNLRVIPGAENIAKGNRTWPGQP